MKHLVATLICFALLVLMVGIYGAILGGTYKDFVMGKPFDPTTVTAMFSPLIYRKVLIAFIIAMVFGVLDIQDLFARPDDASSGPQPRNLPLEFAKLRARRYLLPVMVLFEPGLFFRLIENTGRIERFFTDYDSYIFIAYFALARRPLNMTINEVIDRFNNVLIGFGEGLTGRN